MKNITYLFVPSNDSHVQWMIPIAELLDDSHFMVIPTRNENAELTLLNLGKSFFEYSPDIFYQIQPRVLIMGNDWSPEELLILIQAKANNIFTVCIQEGSLFYPDKVQRLRNADCLFALGNKTKEHFNHPYTIVTGNPKFDQYSPQPFPDNPKIMVNLNFTYGVEERNRDLWLSGVADALSSGDVEYFISAHPRQKTDDLEVPCPVIRSNAFSTKKQIEESTLLISRFSTLIYEAVAAGRKVIYYNPHNEPFVLFHGGYDGVIYEVKSQSQLREIIHQILNSPRIDEIVWNDFMEYHLGTSKRDSAVRCAHALQNLQLNRIQNNLSELIFQSHQIQIDLIKAKKWLEGQYFSLSTEVERLQKAVEEKDGWIGELQQAKEWLAGQHEALRGEVERLQKENKDQILYIHSMEQEFTKLKSFTYYLRFKFRKK